MCISSFLIKTFSDYVGRDTSGNSYYKKGNRRFVVYSGLKEPSKVPPMWHAWLHHLVKDTPNFNQLTNHDWQKTHVPNFTGTEKAYIMKRKKVSSEYQPWKPS
jgi:NADH:ubiquinone oxidoreductase subunit